MRKRLLKYLKRVLIAAILLGGIGLAVFSWLCYWPLEGSVDDLLDLVPEDVEFVLRGDYDDLKSTGWVQANVLEDPLHPLLAEQAGRVLDQVKAQMADIEGQINENIPVDFAKFHTVEDVLEGETCVAGNWCRGFGPDRGPPSWQEILIMTRVSWKTRCIAALRHGFIRDQMGPRLKVSPESDDVFHLTFPFMPVLPERLRTACGGGFVMPPGNEWYLRRVKDVLAISNSKRLIRGVADLAEENGSTRSFATRPGFDIALQPGRITAAVNVAPLHGYLQRVFQYYPALKPIRRFLSPQALEKLSGSVSLGGRDLIEGSAKISYIGQNAPEVQRNVYALGERAVREGISELVPAKDTFAVLSLRVEPKYLLSSIVEDMLAPGDKRLWEENLSTLEGGFDSLDDFFTDLSTRIGTEAMIALGRLSGTFDSVNFTGFWDEAPDAMPALAVMVRVKEGASAGELEEYLATKIPLLGFSKEMERIDYKSFTYMRAQLREKLLDFQLVSPCFLLANNHLILTTNEAYMRQIVETIADRNVPALERDETFRVTMAPLAARGHVGLFVDLEKLTRVPPTSRPEDSLPGSDSRGLLWDSRNQWVISAKDPRTEAIRFRSELEARYRRSNGRRPLSGQQQDEIEEQVDAHLQEWYDLYPRFEEEWRKQLEGLRRLRGLGLVLGGTDTDIDAHVALVFRKGEDWLGRRR